MNNSLMITILSNVVKQAPKVNQETVDNVRAIITHLEKEDEPVEVGLRGEWPKEMAGEVAELIPSIYEEREIPVKPKNKGGRPKKNKNG
jgi:hypothetical protein